MGEPRIQPHRVTKPIQLLAAWLAGLVLVDSAFLTAAGMIPEPSWAPGVLVAASVINVPLFIAALFLLQTRFRPEMQEDQFYAKYLDRRGGEGTGLEIDSGLREEVAQTQSQLVEAVSSIQMALEELSKEVAAASAHAADLELTKTLSRLEDKVSNIGPDLTALRHRVSWQRYEIQLNNRLAIASEAKEALKNAGVPVEIWNTGSEPNPPKVAVGPGFDLHTLRVVFEAISGLAFEWVDYGLDIPGEEKQYENMLLIGSYGYREEQAIPFHEFLAMLREPGASGSTIYSMLRDKWYSGFDALQRAEPA